MKNLKTALSLLVVCVLLACIPTALAANDISIDAAHFPDDAFRSHISRYCDTNQDGFLSEDEIAEATYIGGGRPMVDFTGATNLSGIEYFTAMTTLYCSGNQLTGLDVSQNPALEYLYCEGCDLTNLDVSKNTALKGLYCSGNQLTNLDVSRNTSLETLECRNNLLTSLDLNANKALRWLICTGNRLTSLDLSSNTALTRLDCVGNRLTSLDLSANTSLSNWGIECSGQVLEAEMTAADGGYRLNLADFVGAGNLNRVTVTFPTNAQYDVATGVLTTGTRPSRVSYTYAHGAPNNGTMDVNVLFEPDGAAEGVAVNAANFPDVNFRLYVSQQFDSDGNGALSEEEIAAATAIDVSWRSPEIADLTGIEHFKALTELMCSGNSLTSLDVSEYTALTSLVLDYNQVTSLDVSKNTALTNLSFNGNKLKSLDVSKNTELTSLECGGNQLTSLNVSKNTALTNLSCWGNQLSSLDVSNNTALTVLNCGQNQLSRLDVSKNTALVDLAFSDNKLKDINLSVNTKLERLSCSSNQLTTLDVSGKNALYELSCADNLLTELNLSGNTALKRLYCEANQLTTLDVSKNSALENLGCDENQLTSLDVSKNSALTSLGCAGNHLTRLDLSANTGFSGPWSVRCSGQTAEAALKELNGAYRLDFARLVGADNVGRVTVTSVTPAAEYQFADGILTSETELTGLTYTYAHGGPENGTMDVTLTLEVVVLEPVPIDAAHFPDAAFRSYVSWNCDMDQDGVLSEEEIAAVTWIGGRGAGISGAKSLSGIEYFPALTELWITGNELTELDVSSNTELEWLFCNDNQLTSLDLSANTAIKHLGIGGNPLTSLNLGSNTALTEFDCSGNQLTSLDVSAYTNLISLSCDDCGLTSLELSANTALRSLSCANNRLTSLELSENTALEELHCEGNRLTTLDLSANTALFSWAWAFDCSGQVLEAEMTAVDGGYRLNLADFVGADNLNRVTVTFPTNAQYDVATGILTTGTRPSRVSYTYDHGAPNHGTMDVNMLFEPDSTAEGVAVNAANFPDVNFRLYVSRQFDSDGNGALSNDEIANARVISAGFGSHTYIRNLSGIEFFTALTELDCSGCMLTSLDVSKNTALTSLACDDNNLTSLDVSNNKALSALSCGGNNLNDLDISKNTALEELRCYSNRLMSLDMSMNTALRSLDCSGNQLTSLNVSANTALRSLDCSGNQLTSLNVSANTALRSLSCDFNQLTRLDLSANTALEELYCDNNQLTSLDLSANTALTDLYCDDNRMTSLNLSANTAMTNLYCSGNQLTSLELSANTALRNLSCGGNQLTRLDLSANTALEQLRCDGNQLTSLNLSANTGLTWLECRENQLTSLNLSTNTALTYLACEENQLMSLDLSANTALNPWGLGCSGQTAEAALTETNGTYRLDFARLVGADNVGRVAVTSVTPAAEYQFADGILTSGTELTGLTYTYAHGGPENGTMDVTLTLEVVASKGVAVDATNFPDENFRSYVSQNFDTDHDGFLNTEELAAVTVLMLNSSGIADLTGIEYFVNLDSLSCANNQLTSLNLRANAALTVLHCANNQLTSLDLRLNPALVSLDCANNRLTSLDLSANSALQHGYSVNATGQTFNAGIAKWGDAYRIDLAALVGADNVDRVWVTSVTPAADYQMKNGVLTTETALTGLSYRYFLGSTIDSTLDVTLSLEIAVPDGIAIDRAHFPDDTFRSYVADNFDTDQNRFLNDDEIAAVTEIVVDSQGIADLTGIEYFTALTYLNCAYNQLTELDVSANTALINLYCHNNQLTGLDLSNNILLQNMTCSDNQLTSLNVSANTALTYISCSSNHLTSLDLSKNTALTALNCNEQTANVECTVTNGTYSLNFAELVGAGNVSRVEIYSPGYAQYNAETGILTSEFEPTEIIYTYDYRGPDGGKMYVTLTLTTKVATYTVSYNANGGNGAPAAQTKNDGSALTLASEQPIRNGWYFLGWAESADAAEAAYLPGGSFSKDADTTLYAVWAQPDLVLPAALTSIEEEAFAGGAFRFVKLPEQAVSIDRSAFADCPNLAVVYIPSTVTDIHQDAFGNRTPLTIIGASGSAAETFANAHGFMFVVG